MDIEYIKKNKVGYIGENIEFYDSIGSTQDIARNILDKAINGTVVIADEQTNGRGTKQSKWYSSKGKNITMTIIIKPKCNISKLEGFTIYIGECIRKAIYELYGYNLELKKPNDLMLNGKKIAGILTESSTLNDVVQYILIGIGFNVNDENFDTEIKGIATSLKSEYGKDFNTEEIIIQILSRLSEIEQLRGENE